MAGHDIIAMGASAGGVQTLQQLARGLPKDLPAAVFVTLHLPGVRTSLLPQILDRAGPLPANHPLDGAAIEPGRTYVAPPGLHLLIRPSRVELTRGPRGNGFRPAIDALFRSAAQDYGSRVIGVVLSGSLSDGTLGFGDIHAHGGITVVQDPEDALYRGMPESALASSSADYVVPVSQMPVLLVTLAVQSAPQESETLEPDPSEEVERDLEAYWLRELAGMGGRCRRCSSSGRQRKRGRPPTCCGVS